MSEKLISGQATDFKGEVSLLAGCLKAERGGSIINENNRGK